MGKRLCLKGAEGRRNDKAFNQNIDPSEQRVPGLNNVLRALKMVVNGCEVEDHMGSPKLTIIVSKNF